MSKIVVSSLEDEKKKEKENRKIWTREWLLERNILAELRLKDAEEFRKYLRMNTERFEVLTLVLLFKKNTLFYHVLPD